MKREQLTEPRYLALLQLLRTADRIWNTSRLFFARWDLGPSQFNVLNLLYDHPDGLSQVELSRELIMHRSNVTGLIDRLEKRDLVHRKDLATDRRAYRVVLTKAGIALLEQILPHYYRRAGDVWESMSQERISQLTTDLKQIAENAQRIGSEETHFAHEQTSYGTTPQGRRKKSGL